MLIFYSHCRGNRYKRRINFTDFAIEAHFLHQLNPNTRSALEEVKSTERGKEILSHIYHNISLEIHRFLHPWLYICTNNVPFRMKFSTRAGIMFINKKRLNKLTKLSHSL